MGGNREIWQKDALKDGEFKLLVSIDVKGDIRTISGGFLFFVHMIACKDENVKYFDIQVYCMSYTNRKTTRRREE